MGAAWFRQDRFVSVVARLRPGVSLERAALELSVVRPPVGGIASVRNRIAPLQAALATEARTPLLLLFGFTTLLLVLTCANLANLMLLRAAERAHEVAVRAALGAGRRRILRELLIETLLLAAGGGIAALVVARISIRLLHLLRPPDAWRLQAVPLDSHVLVWACGATLGCTVFFGMLPAWRGLRSAAGAGTSRMTTGPQGRRVARILVGSEIALALVLATGATLLLRSFAALTRVDAGFRTTDRFAAQLLVPLRYNSDPQQLALAERVTASLAALPGVADVTYTSRLPFTGTTILMGNVVADPAEPGSAPVPVGARTIADDYFRVLDVPVVEGRAFSTTDGLDTEPVVIVNETFRRHYFPAGRAVGARITWDKDPGPRSDWYRIVGVVPDQLQLDPRSATRLEVFFAFRQKPGRFLNMLLRVRPGTRSLEPAIRERLSAVDPALAVFSFRSLESVHAETLSPDRSLTLLTAIFASVALFLAVIGIHGATAETVRRRTKEIGIRVALGAQSRDIAGLALRESARLAGMGTIAGLVLALAGSRILASVLFAVDVHDITTWILVPTGLLITAIAASGRPALQAARIDPLDALGRDAT